jgi:2-oxoglutarate dehydrogenase E2 component (dihydrolipoamide succinyltransferase)
MSIEIKSPTFPESVADGTVANWVKKEGESVQQDEVIAEIETDKVVLEVVAPVSGTITKIVKQEGEIVNSSELIAEFNEGAIAEDNSSESVEPVIDKEIPSPKVKKLGPAAKRIIAEENIDPANIKSTGKDGRVTKADLVNHMNSSSEPTPIKPSPSLTDSISFSDSRDEKRVPMSRIRTTIAKRLLTVKQETAMLTTFNEVDMQPIKELRSKYGAEFEKEHGVKLGFMGFFVIAAIQALKKFPLVNASIDKNDIVYHGYQDIGVAVSTERGLVVPVIRDADMLSLPDIEKSILDYSIKARDGKLAIEDLQGGTFTISNGGVFGSLLSTPILNAPQTAILGMHSIQDRPVAVNKEVVIRPMMYLAMSYDHRLLDGKEAVTFLVSIKDQLESPERLLLNL